MFQQSVARFGCVNQCVFRSASSQSSWIAVVVCVSLIRVSAKAAGRQSQVSSYLLTLILRRPLFSCLSAVVHSGWLLRLSSCININLSGYWDKGLSCHSATCLSKHNRSSCHISKAELSVSINWNQPNTISKIPSANVICKLLKRQPMLPQAKFDIELSTVATRLKK